MRQECCIAAENCYNRSAGGECKVVIGWRCRRRQLVPCSLYWLHRKRGRELQDRWKRSKGRKREHLLKL